MSGIISILISEEIIKNPNWQFRIAPKLRREAVREQLNLRELAKLRVIWHQTNTDYE